MTRSTPLVTVIVRTKDRPERLAETLDSVACQTFPNVEVIVVNDGGVDVSAVLERFWRQSSPSTQHFEYISFDANKGRSHAANAGLERASGDFIMLLDDDDWIAETHIEKLLPLLQREGANLAAYSATECRRRVKGRWQTVATFRYEFDPIRLLVENFLPIHSVLFSRALVDAGCRFDPRFERLEDWDFWLQASRMTGFTFLDEISAFYRVSAGSGFGTSSEQSAAKKYRQHIYSKWKPEWTAEEVVELLDRARNHPRLASLKDEVASLKVEHAALEDELAATHTGYQNEYKRFEEELAATHTGYQGQIHRLEHNQRELQNHLDLILNSKTWRYSRVFAAVLRILRRDGLQTLLRKIRNRLPKPFARRLPYRRRILLRYRKLVFPEIASPQVSIIIPVFNKPHYTWRCLRSILEHAPLQPSAEVIVVNDRSKERTRRMLNRMKGIRVIDNAVNQGFIKSVNRGARAARGDYLVFLNNDTEVTADWLTNLYDTFGEFPDAGLVGAKLVYPDGRLQEAGGIVWKDGSGWNYGRGEDADHPGYCYTRPVDYCSGACLMVPREAFMALGMFDEHYLPAYYEDTDLAFRIRQSGKQVYYQANALVVHHEGVTSGTSTISGIKRYQPRNQRKFHSRWHDCLRDFGERGEGVEQAKDRSARRRILIIDTRMIMPDNDSGSLRMFNVMTLLRKLNYRITFLTDNLEYKLPYSRRLQGLGIELSYQPYLKSVEDYLGNFGSEFDVVMLSRVHVAGRYIDPVLEHCPDALVVFDTVDLHFLREQREAGIANDDALREQAWWSKQEELAVARKADITLVVSPFELQLLAQEDKNLPVALLSNIHRNQDGGNAFAQRRDILFVGGFEHPPNGDAVHYFLDEVFPLIKQRLPDLRFFVLGSNPPRDLKARADKHVVVTGFVTDIEPYFREVLLSVAPLRYGAGVKGKINSSMCRGVPVVATTVAAEGMGLTDGEDVLIGDTPQQFAEQVVRACLDQTLWERLSRAGRKNIEEHFSFDVAERQLREILRSEPRPRQAPNRFAVAGRRHLQLS